MLFSLACDFHVDRIIFVLLFFFFNDTATTEIYTLSLHDALPIPPSRLSSVLGSSARSANRKDKSCLLPPLPPPYQQRHSLLWPRTSPSAMRGGPSIGTSTSLARGCRRSRS